MENQAGGRDRIWKRQGERRKLRGGGRALSLTAGAAVSSKQRFHKSVAGPRARMSTPQHSARETCTCLCARHRSFSEDPTDSVQRERAEEHDGSNENGIRRPSAIYSPQTHSAQMADCTFEQPPRPEERPQAALAEPAWDPHR